MPAPIRDPRTGRFRKAPRPALEELGARPRRRGAGRFFEHAFVLALCTALAAFGVWLVLHKP